MEKSKGVHLEEGSSTASSVDGRLAAKPAPLRWLARLLLVENAARLPLRVLRLATEGLESGVSSILGSSLAHCSRW